MFTVHLNCSLSLPFFSAFCYIKNFFPVIPFDQLFGLLAKPLFSYFSGCFRVYNTLSNFADCRRHIAVHWCRLRPPTWCGKAGAALEGCQPGGVPKGSKCQGGMTNVSKVKGEHQKCACIRPARWKESKERGRVPTIPAPPARALQLINVSPSRMTQVLFKLLALRWLREHSLGLQQPFGSPRRSPDDFQRQMLRRLLFLVQVPQAGAWTPRSWWGGSIVVISLPLVGHHPGNGN